MNVAFALIKLEAMVKSLAVEWNVEAQEFRATNDITLPSAPDEWLPTVFIGATR